MPTTLPLPALSQAAQAIRAATTTSLHPATSMAFLNLSATSLTIKATDMDNWLSLSVPCDGPADSLDIQVDATKFADLVAKLSGDTVAMEIKDGSLHLSSGRSKRKLAGVATNYPEVGSPDGRIVAMRASDLKNALAFTAPSVSVEESKASFMGVRLQDGYAVAYNGAGLVASPINFDGSPTTLAPATIKLIRGHIADDAMLDLYTDGRLIGIKWDGGEIVSKPIVGEWPFLANGVDRIMPEHDHHLKVQPSALNEAIAAVNAVAADDKASKSKSLMVRLSKDGCFVSVESQFGSAEEPLDADWDGDDMSIFLASGRLRQILSGFASNEDVTIGITPLPEGDVRPKGCTFRQDGMAGFVGMLAQIRG